MKILHLNAGNETGGGMIHILSLLNELDRKQFYLGLFEKEQFYDKAKEMGINTVLFEQNSRLDFSIIFRVVKFIKKERIDILHTHGARANLFGYLISILTKVTWMTTIHSDPRNDFLGRGIKGTIFTKLNMWVLKRADHYFAISKRFQEMLVEFGTAPEEITTIYNGIEFDKNKIKTYDHLSRENLKLSKNDFVILMVARFDPVKRHNLAIDAVGEISKNHKETKLLLVGDGPTRKEIERLVNQRGLENHIKFLYHRNDVEALYSLADVTLLTSATESFPLVLLESSREKTPVITTDVGGVRDMIPDSSYSWVLNGSEVNEIAAALQHVLQLKKDKKLKEVGERFYQYTSKRFSVQSFAKSIYDAYEMSE